MANAQTMIRQVVKILFFVAEVDDNGHGCRPTWRCPP